MSYGPLDLYRNPGPSGSQLRDFNSIIQTCSGNIQRISQATAQIKNLMSQLGTKQDSSKLQENLQQLQHSTNQLAKETNELLKELGSLPLPLSTSEQRQQKLQKERLMNDFSAALNNFQAVQRRVSEKEKETIARARAGSRLSAEERQREEQLVSFDSHEEWNQMQSQEDEVAITEQDLELIKERETAIQQLEVRAGHVFCLIQCVSRYLVSLVHLNFLSVIMKKHKMSHCVICILSVSIFLGRSPHIFAWIVILNYKEADLQSTLGVLDIKNFTCFMSVFFTYFFSQKKSRKKMCILVLVLSVIIVILGIILWLVNK
ncbi:PREDICTED: syntaxin-12 [Galeopterus variegatus]|uniref:Syntaxin-12 n=1 Tax=Galeopterus variegatus TaxID=482537 RepID=A0ABM0QZK4_GALVR|nr:PREDICTED: syntaxin-12 [Galeopterus variegatus]